MKHLNGWYREKSQRGVKAFRLNWFVTRKKFGSEDRVELSTSKMWNVTRERVGLIISLIKKSPITRAHMCRFNVCLSSINTKIPRANKSAGKAPPTVFEVAQKSYRRRVDLCQTSRAKWENDFFYILDHRQPSEELEGAIAQFWWYEIPSHNQRPGCVLRVQRAWPQMVLLGI